MPPSSTRGILTISLDKDELHRLSVGFTPAEKQRLAPPNVASPEMNSAESEQSASEWL